MSKSMKGFGRAGLSALATSTLVIGACVAGAGAANADSAFQFTRVGGQDRYEVSANVAGMYGSADHVILASGEQGKYADSLAANYLAGAINAPILLTQLNTTPDATMAALKKAGATKITIVGGPLSVSTQQEDALKAAGYTVDRIEGHTRYDVDAAVIKAASKTGDTAIVATGEKFPDALAAGPLAYAKNLPVGLVTLASAPQAVIDALKAQGVTKAIVLGGDLSVSQETRQQLENNGIKIVAQLNGGNRALVATQLADYEIANYGFKSDRVNVATGREFSQGADALSAGPLTGKQMRPLLITAGDPKVGTTQAIGQDLLNWLQGHARTLTGTDNLLFGGPLSITDAMKTAMEKAAQTVTSNQSYNVSPSQATTVNTQANNGDQTVTFSGISASKVSLRLIDCKQDSTNSAGTTTFTDTTPKDGLADTGGTKTPAGAATNATITQINGVSSAYGTGADGVNVSNGSVTVTVHSAQAGCSQLVAFEDKNNDGALNVDANGNPTEPFAVSGPINAVTPTKLAFTNGTTPQTPYGSYTSTVQLEDAGLAPVKLAGIPVKFSRTLPDGSVQVTVVPTDANGQASLTFSATDPNPSTTGDTTSEQVVAVADTNQDGTFGGSDATATQTVKFSDQAAVAKNVAITSPKSGTVDQTGTNQTVTAKLTDQYGAPVQGQKVIFDVTSTTNNAADLQGTGTTDASGVATFTYSRNTPTTDQITASFTAPGAQNGPTGTDQTSVVWSSGVATVNGTNYSTLADAIAAASPGDTITTTGALGGVTNVTKPVTIKGTNGATYDGTIVIDGVNGVTVSGLTITPESYQNAIQGISLNNAQGTTITGNTFVGKTATAANNGAGVLNSAATGVEQATISNNTFKNLKQGVYANPTADFSETGNTFTTNVVGSANDAPSSVTNNTFTNNTLEDIGTSVAGMTITGNTFTTDAPTTHTYIDAAGAPVSSAQVNSWLASNTYNPAAKVQGNNIVPTTHP